MSSGMLPVRISSIVLASEAMPAFSSSLQQTKTSEKYLCKVSDSWSSSIITDLLLLQDNNYSALFYLIKNIIYLA